MSILTTLLIFFVVEFVGQALLEGIRIDGRRLTDFRETTLELSRKEDYSSCEALLGSTRSYATVRGELVTPFPDRPSEGSIQFNSHVSVAAEHCNVSEAEIGRILEKSIRESDSIDTESLCVIAGEKVWSLVCDVHLLEFDGNGLDACLLAAMGALRAYRRPEVAMESSEVIGGPSVLRIFRSDEREPLPLAFHHTPLAVSIGIFSNPLAPLREKVYLLLLLFSCMTYLFVFV